MMTNTRLQALVSAMSPALLTPVSPCLWRFGRLGMLNQC